ncbi:MAG TPA: AAA family ATPase, partial [Beijerinckiaceae bacterium]|nr:AAA family ATPase [Beijerinckiaceae bacterium]
MNRLLVSAAHRSSGKTTVSIGLAAAFSARGERLRPFKKGPDFIDPLWLSRAAAVPCYNLDFNTQSADEIRALFAWASSGCDLALIEGNKGLHDGMDVEGADSSAALAKLLDAPVLLVLDVTGITRGVAPLLMGQAAFDPDVNVCGVVLNRVVSARQEAKLRQAIERYSAIPVLGALPRDGDLLVKERPLGLTTPGDAGGVEAR